MATTFSNLICSILLCKKTSTVFLFLICFSTSFSQLIGKGELLTETTLEMAIAENHKNERDNFDNILVNYHFVISLSETKISTNDLLEKIKSISQILECSLVKEELIIITKKTNGDSLLPSLKEILALQGVKLLSKTELFYKN